jgi:hypothetical protein
MLPGSYDPVMALRRSPERFPGVGVNGFEGIVVGNNTATEGGESGVVISKVGLDPKDRATAIRDDHGLAGCFDLSKNFQHPCLKGRLG